MIITTNLILKSGAIITENQLINNQKPTLSIHKEYKHNFTFMVMSSCSKEEYIASLEEDPLWDKDYDALQICKYFYRISAD